MGKGPCQEAREYAVVGTGRRGQGHRAQGAGQRAQGTGRRAQGTGHRARARHKLI